MFSAGSGDGGGEAALGNGGMTRRLVLALDSATESCTAALLAVAADEGGVGEPLEVVAARREESAEFCRNRPTETPEGLPGPEGWPTPSGAFVGRVVEQTPLESDKIYIRGRVLDRNGRGVGGVVVKIQAWDWSVTHVSDGNGLFSFDGLNQPVAYTLSLENYPGASVEAPGEWGKITWVEFKERG